MFRVGDIVECTVRGVYSITTKGVPCKVCRICCDGRIEVEILSRPSTPSCDWGNRFVVNARYFKRHTNSKWG